MNMKLQSVLRVLLHRGSTIIDPASACNALFCAALTILLLSSGVSAAAGETSGTLVHKTRTVTLEHAYLIKGPDATDTKSIIRRLVLSGRDISARIQECKTMSCAEGEVAEGLIVDLISGQRLNYWMAINNGLVQHSGTLRPTVLKASVDDGTRIAGKLSFDDTSAGGPKVEVDFEATILKEFTVAR